MILTTIGVANAAPRGKPNQIRYEYVPPKDPVHQPIHDQMKQGRALEHLQNFSVRFAFPIP